MMSKQKKTIGIATIFVLLLSPVALAQQGGKGKTIKAKIDIKSKARKFIKRKAKTIGAITKAKKEFKGKAKASFKLEDPKITAARRLKAMREWAHKKRIKLIATLQRIRDRRPDYSRMARVLFQQSELLYEQSQYYYFKRRIKYEKEMEDFLEGKLKEKPMEPKPSYKDSIANYKLILREHPGFRRLDEVIYHLAESYKNMGMTSQAVPYFQKLVQQHPKSKFVPDAQLGLAEYFFQSDLLYAARDGYLKVLKFNKARVFNYALYKLAWCYFNLGGREKKYYRIAVDTFKKVIGNIDRQGEVKRYKIEFRNQALNDLVVAFSALPEGIEEARQYFMKRGGMKLAVEKLERLAKYYLANDQDPPAIKIYRWFISLQPEGKRVPDFLAIIIESLKRIGKRGPIEREQLAMIEKFKPVAPYSQKHKGNAELLKKVRRMAEEAMEELYGFYHENAQKFAKKRKENYLKAAQFRKLFLKNFPDSSKATAVKFYLAEIIYFQQENYAEASAYYEDVVKAGSSPYLAEAAEKRILCYNHLMRTARKRTKLGRYYRYARLFKGKWRGRKGKAYKRWLKQAAAKVERERKRLLVKKTIPKWEVHFVNSSDDYVKLVKKPTQAVPVMYNAAQIYFYNHHYSDAIQRYAYIVDNYPKHKFAGYAANDILECYNRVRDWAKMEFWAKKLREIKGFKGRSKKELNRIVALSIFKQADEKNKAKNPVEAAVELLRLQKELPNDVLSREALYSAASYYSVGRKNKEAVATFEKMIRTYPKSPKVPDAIFTIASIFDGTANFQKAAENFERLKKFPRYKQTSIAVFNAAALRRNLAQFNQSIDNLKYYRLKFRKTKEAGEAIFRIGQLYEEQKDWKNALTQYKRYTNLYKSRPNAVQAYVKIAMIEERLGRKRAASIALKNAIWRSAKHIGRILPPRKIKGKTVSRLGKGGGIKRNAVKQMVADWAAHARYLQAEQVFVDRYEKLKFQLPKRRMGRQMVQKGKMLKNLVNAFEHVIEFASPRWGVCAIYMIGRTYKEFANAFLTAPVPKGLNANEAQFYKIKMQEKALPVEDKAWEAYKTTLKTAMKKKVLNQCVLAAGNALAAAKADEHPVAPEKAVKPSHISESILCSPHEKVASQAITGN